MTSVASPAKPFTWSPQQEAVFAWFSRNDGFFDSFFDGGIVEVDINGDLVVRARAGTGKTTTILEGITRAPEQRILLAAFNNRIAEELKKKNRTANAEVKTLHGVGFACVRRWKERIRVEERTGNRQNRLAEEVCGGQAPDAIKRLVGKLFTKAREMAPHATERGSLLDVAEEFDCIPDPEWLQAGFDLDYVEARALDAMKLGAEIKSGEEIDFADMLFLPVRNSWITPLYDLGVCDEAQDMSATQLELFMGVVKGRKALVGDDRQAIYGFRGADSESLDRLKAELKAGELGLNITRRCPKAVVALAQLLVPDFKAADDAPEGKVSSLPTLDALVADAQPGDFVLSRANAPLARVAMALIRSNKRTRIQGKDIGAGLKALVKKLATGKAANSIAEVLAKLSRWEEKEVERVMKADRPERAESIRDKADTLRVLCEGVYGVRELEARLDSLFADSGGLAVVCSSVHKAKGLEAPKVYVLRPTLYPALPPSVKPSPSRAKEEQNIHYVAITRAMEHLVWVEAK